MQGGTISVSVYLCSRHSRQRDQSALSTLEVGMQGGTISVSVYLCNSRQRDLSTLSTSVVGMQGGTIGVSVYLCSRHSRQRDQSALPAAALTMIVPAHGSSSCCSSCSVAGCWPPSAGGVGAGGGWGPVGH